MNPAFIEWAEHWKIPAEAIAELCLTCLHEGPRENKDDEGVVQAEIRLKAGRTAFLPWGRQTYLFRNNRGAGQLKNGSFVRWGLANDSKPLGERIKSGDLIGWEQILITQADVGRVISQFLSVEVKRRDWKFAASAEECAQVQWASIVNAQGGKAIITNTDGSISK
jgi:hypothetical protein